MNIGYFSSLENEERGLGLGKCKSPDSLEKTLNFETRCVVRLYKLYIEQILNYLRSDVD